MSGDKLKSCTCPICGTSFAEPDHSRHNKRLVIAERQRDTALTLLERARDCVAHHNLTLLLAEIDALLKETA